MPQYVDLNDAERWIRGQMSRLAAVSVRRAGNLSFAYVPRTWHLADQWRQEIDIFFSDERKENPSFEACCVMSNSLIEPIVNLFRDRCASLFGGARLVCHGVDGFGVLLWSGDLRLRLTLGEMAPQCRATLFPSGSVERLDVIGGEVDFEGAPPQGRGRGRDLAEDAHHRRRLARGSRWPCLPLIKTARLDELAEKVRRRLLANL
jgi:hypothetical protein